MKRARSRGRPSLYTEELAELICERLMEGESLRRICTAEDMPHRVTVLRWLASDEEFRAKYAAARELQADAMDDLITELIETCTPESAPPDRVRLAALQWRAAKLAPKKYGDKLDLNQASKEKITVRWMTEPPPPE
jgi:hypothetical protein